MNEYELFIGPQHPGVTGNMMYHLWVDGDTVTKAECNVGYLHRGFEKLMESRGWMQNVPLVCRICVPEPDVNEMAYSMAVEELMGWEVPERASYLRVIVLELARIAAHLMSIGSYGGSLGIYTIPQWSLGDRDYLLDIFEQITGARVYHIYIWPGGVRWDMPDDLPKLIEKTLSYIEKRLELYDDVFFKNRIFFDRAVDIGRIPRDKAIEWGVTGPNLRACGQGYDVRKLEPYAVYEEMDFEIVKYPELGKFDVLSDGGDAYTRMLVRRLEIEQSISIVRQALKKLPAGDHLVKHPNWLKWKAPAGHVYKRVESSKGEYGYFVVSDGSDKPVRIHVRGPSYTHGVNVAETILKGANMADVSQILFSLDVCPPDIER
ncbi:MAG: NADH-quinone oxidoreductase subunit D [Thermoplasmata archaeon]|nr:NADH-quinone oxidoreductase subunit D [Thermoplasmata archaeon]HHH77851.1 NADH-quinone oxidoreductase subunit D [Thermoplasmatales archaeon]